MGSLNELDDRRPFPARQSEVCEAFVDVRCNPAGVALYKQDKEKMARASRRCRG
jgi:hypothetical protein